MVYFLRSQRTGLIKIGRTSFLRSRRSQLDFQYGEALQLLGVVSEDAWAERQLHKLFKSIHAVNEWFKDEPVLRRFIEQHATLDLAEADTPRNEIMVPIDRHIAQMAKKNAEKRSMSLSRYLDDLLRQAVDDDFKKL